MALRKIEILLNFEVDMTVVAPEPENKITYHARHKKLKLEKREYKSPEASEYGLVISASDDRDVNKKVHDDCLKANIPVNVVDNPDLCTFIFPAIIMRDCLTISMLSDGKAPFLSGQLRAILEDLFPDHWSKIAHYAALFRIKVNRRWKGEPQKKADCFARFVGADWKKLLKELSESEIDEELDNFLE